MILLATCMSSLETVYVDFSAHFFIGLLGFFDIELYELFVYFSDYWSHYLQIFSAIL